MIPFKKGIAKSTADLNFQNVYKLFSMVTYVAL